MSEFEDLQKTLTLDPIEVNLYRGHSADPTRGRIFGGQVIAQALLAAYRTVGHELTCHSLHAYFIRPGDPKIPVLYQVERARDGKSFATRRVAAIQHGEQVFNLAASFQVAEEGLDHQFAPPETPMPEELEDATRTFMATLSERQQVSVRSGAIDIRPVGLFQASGGPPRSGACLWFKPKAKLSGDQGFQQAVLAFASDAGILETSMRPHGLDFFSSGMQVASLDHALWFHRPIQMDDWHLYVQDSPSASGARGFTRGLIYSRDGALVASVVQEGLIRQRPSAGPTL